MKMRKVLSMLLATLMLLTMLPLGAVSVSAAGSWNTSYLPLSGNGANDIVAVAQAQLEKTQSQLSYSGQWCARFVSDCASRAGQSDAVPYDASTSSLYNKVLNAGGYVVTSPQKGDLAFYKNNSGFQHVSIVSNNDGTTIHGNVSWCTSKGRDDGVWHVCTRKPNVYENAMGQYHIYVRPNYKSSTSHTHNYSTYVYYEAQHPHYKCYQCSCGEVKANYSETTYVSTCETCNPPCTHTYDNDCDPICNDCGTTREAGAHNWANATCTAAKACTICGTSEGAPLGHNWDITNGQCTICGERVTEQYTEWSENLPADITEDLFDIETKTVYRYRDNSSYVSYGAWSAEQTTSTRPTESDTLTITSTTTYYNYYHICCNYYGGQNNVDSIEYGSGSHYRHTIRLTYELTAKSVPDKGGKQMYGSYTCGKGFNVWAKADQYVTYEYKYKTRTATNVTDYGTWSDWSDSEPSAAANRNVESKTLYRYKLKHVHMWADATCTTPKTCTDCGAIEGSALEHNYVATVTTPATCGAVGVKSYTCSACGDAYTEVIPATADHIYDHDYDATCNVCGAVREVEIPGDANGDGVVTVRDVALLQQYLAGWDVTLDESAAYADGDGRVSTRDVALLQQYLAGWDVELG